MDEVGASWKAGACRVLAATLGYAAMLLGCGELPLAPPNDRWNVLVLVPDTVRADHLSVNGYPKPTSPALETLAQEGVNFTQAITVAPRTWQSFASLLTGLYPPRHGVRFLFDRPLAAGTPTLASTLSEAGYETIAFDVMNFVPAMTREVRFDSYGFGTRRGGRIADEVLLEKVAAWIEAQSDRPFLTFVRMEGAHWPYRDDRWIDEFESCEGHDHSFNQGSYGVEPRMGEGPRLTDAEANRRVMWNADYDDATFQHMIAHYDAEIRLVDELIGRLLDALRSSGVMERTVVVVTSDHGEAFYEHGYLQHGPRVDDPVMRVPLLLHLPPEHPAHAEGLTVDALVRTVDIFPTLLDAVGVPAPAGIDGVSLLPLVREEDLEPLWAYGESGRSFVGIDPERRLPGVAGKLRMIRTTDWKLVYIPGPEGGESRLHDLRSDPSEQVQVSAPRVVWRLRERLDPILAVEPPRGRERALSAAELEQLRELGYLR